MEVRRLWGRCGGQDVIFARRPNGCWQAAVPPASSGEYLVELWAEDGAGNVGYMATLLMTYDPIKRCVSTRLLDVGEAWSVETVRACLGLASTGGRLVLGSKPAISMSAVDAKMVRCELCGR